MTDPTETPEYMALRVAVEQAKLAILHAAGELRVVGLSLTAVAEEYLGEALAALDPEGTAPPNTEALRKAQQALAALAETPLRRPDVRVCVVNDRRRTPEELGRVAWVLYDQLAKGGTAPDRIEVRNYDPAIRATRVVSVSIKRE